MYDTNMMLNDHACYGYSMLKCNDKCLNDESIDKILNYQNPSMSLAYM